MKKYVINEDFIFKNFGVEGGGAMVKSSLVRLYTLIDGFDATHVGLYAYFRSWRNSTDKDRLNTVWHSKEYMQIQTGLGRKAFNSRLSKLVEVGLITEIPSQSNPMKKIYYVHDPLSRDEFIKKYPDEINRFAKKLEEMERKNNEYKERRKQKELESIRKVQKKDGII